MSSFREYTRRSYWIPVSVPGLQFLSFFSSSFICCLRLSVVSVDPSVVLSEVISSPTLSTNPAPTPGPLPEESPSRWIWMFWGMYRSTPPPSPLRTPPLLGLHRKTGVLTSYVKSLLPPALQPSIPQPLPSP